MGKKKPDEKLERAYLSVIQEDKDEKIDKRLIIFDQKIYFDKRQYSLKLPTKLYDYIDYDEKDMIRIIVDDTDPDKPKIALEYIKGGKNGK
mgnify:CR=1 FL=1